MEPLILTPIDVCRKGKFYLDMSDSDSWWWVKNHLDEAKEELIKIQINGFDGDPGLFYWAINTWLIKWFGEYSNECT